MTNTKTALTALISLPLYSTLALSQSATGPAPGIQLEEIVVTAQKREESAQRSALAIAVLGGEDLAEKGITDTRQLLDSVPGLDVTFSAPYQNLSLRGLGSGASTQFGDPAMNFNVGGVPLGRAFSVIGAMYDLQRVEVLKGPQGTLYGRNATVGALNLVPNKPTHTYEGSGSFSFGNYNALNTTGMLNLPLSDSLAARVAFATNHHEGYLSNGYDDANNQGGRLSLLYTPNDDVSLLVWADYFHNDAKGPGSIFTYVNPGQQFQFPNNPWFAYQPAGCGDPNVCPTWGDSAAFIPGAPAGPLASQSVVAGDGFIRLSQEIYAAQLDWNLGGSTLTVLPAYVGTQMRAHNYIIGLDFKNVGQFIKQESIEARLASNATTPFKWLVGSIYYNETQDADQRSLETAGYNILRTPDLKSDSWAVFGELTYSLTNWWRLTGGLRYSDDHKEQSGFTLIDNTIVFGTPSVNATNCNSSTGSTLVAGPTTAYGETYPTGYCIVPNVGSLDNKQTSWKVGTEFDVAENSLLYVNARTGYHVGGFGPGLPPNTYKPEKLTAYELGSKNRFFDQRLQANLELFYWDYQDQQINILQTLNPAGQSSYPVNASGYVRGAELTLDALLTRNDTVGLDALFEEGRYDLFPQTITTGGVLGGLTDYPRVNMPKWSGTLSYEHRFNFNGGAQLAFNAGMHYESATWLRVPSSTFPLTAADRRDAFNTEDASLTFTPAEAKWHTSVYVNNLTDEAVISTGTGGAISRGVFFRPKTNPSDARYSTLAPPRTYGLRFTAEF